MARKSAAEIAKENAQKGIDGLSEIGAKGEPEPKQEQRAVISAQAPVSLIKQLDTRATFSGKKRADIILDACNEYVKNHPISDDMIQKFLAMANAE